MTSTTPPARSPHHVVPVGDLRATWLIAHRGALESLRDRTTLITSAVFSLVVPFLTVLLIIWPQAGHSKSGGKAAAGLGMLVASYLLVIGLLPTSGSASVAAGLFAGEMEQGNLAPLLATPASNRAIFGGKVLGAVLPSLIYALIAVSSYLLEVALVLGPGTLGQLPPVLSLAMVVLVPTCALLGATVASLISSRVRTYQAAQVLSSLTLLPIMGGLFGLTFALPARGPGFLAVVVVILAAAVLALILVGAATWQREEMMARR